MVVPVPYTDIPEGFLAWLKTERENGTMGRALSHKLCAHLSDVYNIVTVTDTEVIENIVLSVLHAITNKDPTPSKIDGVNSRPQSPSIGKVKGGSGSTNPSKKDVTPSTISYQIDLASPDPYIEREAFFYRSGVMQDANHKTMRIAMLNTLLFATSQSLIKYPEPASLNNVQTAIELAHRAILTNHIPPGSCLPLSISQYTATASFVECLCVAVEKAIPLLWKGAKEYTDAYMQQRPKNNNIRKILSDSVCHEITCVLSCLSGFLKVFLGHYDELLGFIVGQTGSNNELYPTRVDTTTSDKMKGKEVPAPQFDALRFNIATSNRELLRKINQTYLNLSEVISNALQPILGTFSTHRIVIPYTLCEAILLFHTKYELIFSYIQRKFEFLNNSFKYLKEYISDKGQLPPDYLAYCELLTGAPRKPGSFEAANTASSSHYAALTKEYLTACNSFLNMSKLAGLCCTVLLFYEPNIPASIPEDSSQHSENIGTINTIKIIQSPNSYSFPEALLVSALSTLYRMPRSRKLPSQDDCAAVISFCHLPIFLFALSLETTELFPDFIPRKDRSANLTTIVSTFISNFGKIYKQSMHCLSLVAGRPIYRYDIKGDILTYYPDTMYVIQSIVINTIILDILSISDKSEKCSDKKQSFISNYTTGTNLSSVLPMLQPLLDIQPLQISCYLAIGFCVQLLLKHSKDNSRFYSLCLTTLLDINNQFINLPTNTLLTDGPSDTDTKRPPSTSATKKGDKKVAVVETATTLQGAASRLSCIFKDPFPLTFTFLRDILYMGTTTLYAIGFGSAYPIELYTSGTIASVFTFLENLYLLLMSKYLTIENSNELVDISLSITKTYLEYARFNTIIFPYESQGMLPERAASTNLVRRIYNTTYEAVALLVDGYKSGRVDIAMYNRYVADIIIGFIVLLKRAMHLAYIEIADQLFELYELISSSSGSSISQTQKSMTIVSADKELLTETRNIVASVSASAGQQLLLKQTAGTLLPLCIDDMFRNIEQTIRCGSGGTQLPPTTMVQPIQWMQALVSLCIETLMLHTRYFKCLSIFQSNMFLVVSSYELSLYYLVLLITNGQFADELRPFITSINLPEVQMINLLFAGIKLLLSTPEVLKKEYTRLSESVLFLLEIASLRLESLSDAESRGKFFVPFSALKYSTLIQLGLYSEEEHDCDLFGIITKESENLFIQNAPPVSSQSTTRPSSRTTSSAKQPQKQIKTDVHVTPEKTAAHPPVSEDLISLVLSYLTRKSKMTTPSSDDLQIIYLYHKIMVKQMVATGWQTDSVHIDTDPSAFTEQYLLQLLKGLNTRIETGSAMGPQGLIYSVSKPVSMVGPSHVDICLLILSDYIENVVLQQHSFLDETSHFSTCSYTSFVIIYGTFLIESLHAYLTTLTWYSLANVLISLQSVIAWLRDYGVDQLWSLLAIQLDKFVTSTNLFTNFERFTIESSRCGFGSLILRQIQSKILTYAINSTLWGSIFVGNYILNETPIGTETLNISLFENALHRLYSRKASSTNEMPSFQPFDDDVSSYITLCYTPRLLLDGIIAFFQSHIASAQCTIHALDLLVDEGTYQIAVSHISDKISAELSKRSVSVESPLHDHVPHLSIDIENHNYEGFYMNFALIDIYLRLTTAVRLLIRADMSSFQIFLHSLLIRAKQLSSTQETFRDKHLATIRSFKPCSPLLEEGQHREAGARFLSDYTKVGTKCYLLDSLFIQKVNTTQATILECIHTCKVIEIYGDNAYRRGNYYAHHFFSNDESSNTSSEKLVDEGGISPDVLDAGAFINHLAIHILQSGALGTSMASVFSDYIKYSLMFIRPNRVLHPTNFQLQEYHSSLIECITFLEDILSYISDHPLEQVRIIRLSILIIITLLAAPHFSLKELIENTELNKTHISIIGMVGKRLELATLILLKLTCPSFVLGSPQLQQSPVRQQMELLKAVILERLAFVVEAFPEQIQDIVLGSNLVTNHVVARWLTETTSSFIFDPISVTVVDYCKNPVSFCVHLSSLIFKSNEALLASRFCRLDLSDLNLSNISSYSSSDESVKEKATNDLITAINDAADFNTQLLRLFLTRGPFKQTQTCIIPSIDTIVACYNTNMPPFTEALPNLLAELNNNDKKAGVTTDKKVEQQAPTAYAIHSLPQAIFALSTLAGLYRQGFKEFLRIATQTGVCLLEGFNIDEFISSRCTCTSGSGSECDVPLNILHSSPSTSAYSIRLVCVALLGSLDFHSAINGQDDSIEYIELLITLAKEDGSIPNFIKDILENTISQKDETITEVKPIEKSAPAQKKQQQSSNSDNTCQILDFLLSTKEFHLLKFFYNSLQTLLSISASYSHTPFVLEVFDHLIYSRLSRTVSHPSLSDMYFYLARSSILTDIQTQLLSQIIYLQSQKFVGPMNVLSNILWSSGAVIGNKLLIGTRASSPILVTTSSQGMQLQTLFDSHYDDLLKVRGEYVVTQKRPATGSAQGSGKDVKGKSQQTSSASVASLLDLNGSLVISPDFLTISPERAHIFTALFQSPISTMLKDLDSQYLKLQYNLLSSIELSLPGVLEKCKTIVSNAVADTGIYLQLAPILKWIIICYIQRDNVIMRPIATLDSYPFNDRIVKLSLLYTDWYSCVRRILASYWNYVPASVISQLQSSLNEIETDMDPERETVITKNLFVYLKSIRKEMSRLYYGRRSARSRVNSALTQSEVVKTTGPNNIDVTQLESTVRVTRPLSPAVSQRSTMSPKTTVSAKLINTADLYGFLPLNLKTAIDLLCEILRPLCDSLKDILPLPLSSSPSSSSQEKVDSVTTKDIASDNEELHSITFILSDYSMYCLPYTILLNIIFSNVRSIRIVVPRLKSNDTSIEPNILATECSKGGATIDIHDDISFACSGGLNLGLTDLIQSIRNIFNHGNPATTLQHEVIQYLNEASHAFVCSFTAPQLIIQPLLISAKPDLFAAVKKIVILHSEFEFSNIRARRNLFRAPSLQFMASDIGVRLSLLSSGSRVVVMNEIPFSPAITASITLLYLLDYLKQKIDETLKKNKPPTAQEKKPQGTKKPPIGTQETQVIIRTIDLTEMCTKLLREHGETLIFNSVATYVS